MVELYKSVPFLVLSPGQCELSLAGHGGHFHTACGGSAAGTMLCDYSVSGGLLSSLLFPPTDGPVRFVLLGVLCLSRAIRWLRAIFLSHTVDFSQPPAAVQEKEGFLSTFPSPPRLAG